MNRRLLGTVWVLHRWRVPLDLLLLALLPVASLRADLAANSMEDLRASMPSPRASEPPQVHTLPWAPDLALAPSTTDVPQPHFRPPGMVHLAVL